MKINRTGQTENNKTTAFWLHEFAYDLEKNAKNVDYLKDYINKNYNKKKFNTIEEKLADIKQRVGFELAQKITNEIEKTSAASEVKEAGCGCKKSCEKCKGECNCKPESCSCTTTKTASEKHNKSEKDVRIMQNILKYIKDMIKHEPHLDSVIILARCKENDSLRYNDIHKKIDQGKLINYINELLSNYGSRSKDELGSYVPSSYDGDYTLDDKADYASHAEPVRR